MEKVYLVYEWDRCDRSCAHRYAFVSEIKAEKYVEENEGGYGLSLCVEEIELDTEGEDK